MKLERILVPVDFSEMSARALQAADQLATLANAEEVTLLHVHQISQLAIMDFTYVEPPEKIAKIIGAAEAQLEEMAAMMHIPEAKRKIVVETGRPIDVIIEKSTRFDLIIMPTHGRSGASHFFLGSVAERIVQGARCSVFVVK